MRIRYFLLLLYATAGLLAEPVFAQTEARLALLIGNAAYKSSPLTNPVNDVRLMETVLTEAGFTIMKAENASIREMRRLVREFGDRLKSAGGVGLFYFAGHGVQVRGENYLVSTDSDIRNEDEVADDSVNASVILEKMQFAGNRMNLIVLDACRNNPFAVKSRTAASGLAAVSAPSGSLVAYATAPGSVASDGNGRNGLYTEHLAKAIRQPGLSVEEVFKQVRSAVRRDSGNQQTPWENTALEGQFYFKPPMQSAAATAAPIAVAPNAGDTVAVELAYWDSVKNSQSRVELQAYLTQYPSGRFAALATARLQAIGAPGDGPVKPAPVAAPVAVATAPVTLALAPASAPARVTASVAGEVGTLVTTDPLTKLKRSTDVTVLPSKEGRTVYSTGDVIDSQGLVVQALIGEVVLRVTSGALWTVPLKPGMQGAAFVERVGGSGRDSGSVKWKSTDLGQGQVQLQAEVAYVHTEVRAYGTWRATYSASNPLPDSFSSAIRAIRMEGTDNIVSGELKLR